jgi:hypothetical protein
MHGTSVKIKDKLDKLSLPDSRALLVVRFVKE